MTVDISTDKEHTVAYNQQDTYQASGLKPYVIVMVRKFQPKSFWEFWYTCSNALHSFLVFIPNAAKLCRVVEIPTHVVTGLLHRFERKKHQLQNSVLVAHNMEYHDTALAMGADAVFFVFPIISKDQEIGDGVAQ